MQELKSIGLTNTETKVYIYLLKRGEAIAADIAANTYISRTYVYDAVKSLEKKGLVSFAIKGGKKFFSAAPPSKILDYLEERKNTIKKEEAAVRSILPHLNALISTSKQTPQIEIYEGKEGLKTVLNDFAKAGKEGLVWGGSRIIEKIMPEYTKQYLRERAKHKTRIRQIYSEPAGYLKHKYTKVKMLPKNYFSPSTIITYGNKVIIAIWSEIPVAILIESREAAKSFRDHFELMWNSVK